MNMNEFAGAGRLFDLLQIGEVQLANRVIGAALTGVEPIPNALMTEYDVQRTSAGMITARLQAVP
jgi:2,4-dienoyl-CoA reductase-like NADH-dependent reductase (Old Yellow Enzyme family)